MDWEFTYKFLALVFSAISALNALLVIIEKARSRSKTLADSKPPPTISNAAIGRVHGRFRLTQKKINNSLNWIAFFVLYGPFAVLWSIGINQLTGLLDDGWTRWVLSLVFVYGIWYSGLVLFRLVRGHNYRTWAKIWVISSLYGGLGVLLLFYPSIWQPNRVVIAVVASVLIVSFQIVGMLDLVGAFQDWVRKLPEN
jgi:hypothetical protein